MFEFLKKPGRRPNSICDPTATSGADNASTSSTEEELLARLHTIEQECLGTTAPLPVGEDSRRSRLFLTLPEILHDQNCLCYFVQFMESVSEVALIKFWMAVENFRISARANSNNCDSTQHRKTKFQTSVAADALKILERYLCSNSDAFIDIPAETHARVSLSMCTVARDDANPDEALVSPECFSEAQQFVVERLEREFLRRFLDSAFYCKYSLDILTGGDLRLADVLYSECALFYFMEFLEQEHTRDLLDFWMCATNFRRHSTEAQAARGDAMVLYEKYFSLQATNPLQMSNAVRLSVEEQICSRGSGEGASDSLVACFDLPIRIVERLLGEFYLERFLHSQLFYKYVSDLVTRSTQREKDQRQPRVTRTQSLTKESLTGRRHRKTNSDGGGGDSLLRRTSSIGGTEDQQHQQVAKLGSTVELRIDARMLCGGKGSAGAGNATNGLSFGRVDALGRFERDFEWEEGGGGLSLGNGEESAGSRLKKVVKKLVHLPEDKVQEELAWQVAEMIVRDVTDITLNGGRSVAVDRRSSGGVGVVEEE